MTGVSATPEDLATGAWSFDPSRSTVEFRVPNFWGLVKVKGHFATYEGKLDLNANPAVQLTIDAASLDTRNKKRDKHLRAADFFDVKDNPQVRFTSDRAQLDGQTLTVHGTLEAAGNATDLDLRATVTVVDGEPVIEAETTVDRGDLGMTWNRIGMIGMPSTLHVKGTLVRG
jgi:polyisoprenoid-binding protein YceI